MRIAPPSAHAVGTHRHVLLVQWALRPYSSERHEEVYGPLLEAVAMGFAVGRLAT